MDGNVDGNDSTARRVVRIPPDDASFVGDEQRRVIRIPPLSPMRPVPTKMPQQSPEIEEVTVGVKRRVEVSPVQTYSPHYPAKRIKKTPNIGTFKNPMEYFNHLFAGALPIFSFQDESDPVTKAPHFKASITVGDQTYTGSGSSKKDAKQMCAADYIGHIKAPEVAERLLYLYQNQQGVTPVPQPLQTGVMQRTGAGQSGHWMLSPSKPGQFRFTFLPNESPAAYLYRIFGPKAIYSDPLVNRTRHGPITLITLYIYGIPGDGIFHGEGHKEEDAQEHAAALALRHLKHYPNLVAQLESASSTQVEDSFWADSQNVDWNYPSTTTEDEGLGSMTTLDGSQLGLDSIGVGSAPIMSMIPAASKSKMNKEYVENRLKQPNITPLVVINELAGQTMQYDFTEERGEKQQREYVLKAVFCGREYTATGRSKKDAKMNAACQILREEFSVVVASESANPAVLGDEVPDTGNKGAVEAHTEFANELQKLVKDTFFQLSMDKHYSKYKVLAGIAMTRNESWNDFQIICVTTGTKTLNGEHISTAGSVIHDCHAEILAKRCLRRYLYSELYKCVEDMQDESIFELNSKPQMSSDNVPQTETNTMGYNGFRLKKGIRFHLYINTTPCGDARIFSPHEVSSGTDSTPSRKNRGLLRVKIEAGEGTIPSTNEDLDVQTFDGILAGKRLLNLSCSDKVLRMNVLGLQGGLLSWFIEPVYLSSIVIGSFYHADHLQRAVVTRFKELEENCSLVPPFRTAQPLLCSVSIHETRQPSKAPGYAMNWTCIDPEVEIIDCAKGKAVETGEISRLCKKSFYTYFRDLQKVTSNVRSEANQVQEGKPASTYRDCKRQAADFKQCKAAFIKGLERSECGKWLCKPQEVDTFC